MSRDLGPLTRWSSDLELVHTAVRHIITDSLGSHRLGVDPDGEFLQFSDLATGVAWRARVTDPATGTWAQDIWALHPNAATPDWNDPDTARLALQVALASPPLRRIEHRPFTQRQHPGPPGRVYLPDWAPLAPASDALRRVQAQGMFWYLANTAALTRWTAPWEEEFGLSDAWMDDGGSGTGIAYAEARLGRHRLTLTAVDAAYQPWSRWRLMISDARIPLDPHQPAPDAERPGFVVPWQSETITTWPGATLHYAQFVDAFRELCSRLGPFGPAFAAVPDELQALAAR